MGCCRQAAEMVRIAVPNPYYRKRIMPSSGIRQMHLISIKKEVYFNGQQFKIPRKSPCSCGISIACSNWFRTQLRNAVSITLGWFSNAAVDASYSNDWSAARNEMGSARRICICVSSNDAAILAASDRHCRRLYSCCDAGLCGCILCTRTLRSFQRKKVRITICRSALPYIAVCQPLCLGNGCLGCFCGKHACLALFAHL